MSESSNYRNQFLHLRCKLRDTSEEDYLAAVFSSDHSEECLKTTLPF